MLWHDSFVLGIESEGCGGFGEGIDAGGAAMALLIGTKVVSREISVHSKI